jgi:O-antigen ligase
MVFIFMIPWEEMVRLPGFGNGSKFIGLMVAAFWLLLIVTRGRLRKPGLFHIMVYLFVLWNGASVLWSVDPQTSFDQVRTWFQLLVLVIVLWDLYTTRAALYAGLQAYILGTYVAIGSAIANYYTGSAFYYQRFSPDDTNPDGFGFIVALGIPVAWYLVGSTSSSRMSFVLRWANYAYIPAALLGLALSGTRTALIASTVGMTFGLASMRRLPALTRISIFLLLTSAILILLPYVQTLKSFQRLATTGTEIIEGDLNNRTNNWREGLIAFVEHPLLGVGSNMYRSVNSWGKVAHNTFLSVLVESGLIGFCLFGIVLAISVHHALGHSRWDSMFWFSMLLVLAIGASTLSWEDRKTTWLFLSLLIASSALNKHSDLEPDH